MVLLHGAWTMSKLEQLQHQSCSSAILKGLQKRTASKWPAVQVVHLTMCIREEPTSLRLKLATDTAECPMGHYVVLSPQSDTGHLSDFLHGGNNSLFFRGIERYPGLGFLWAWCSVFATGRHRKCCVQCHCVCQSIASDSGAHTTTYRNHRCCGTAYDPPSLVMECLDGPAEPRLPLWAASCVSHFLKN